LVGGLKGVVVDVYAALTVDLVNGRWLRGGPLRFVHEALVSLGLGKARPGCFSSGAVFTHRERAGVRVSQLLRAPRRCRLLSPVGDAALVAPVYWELGAEDAASVARLGYRAVVYDLQGFLRLPGRGGLEAGWFLAEPVATYLAGAASAAGAVVVVKASLEDLGGCRRATGFVEREGCVLTLGPFGACLGLGDGRCLYCRPALPRPELPATGAGDVFGAVMAALLAQGTSLKEALCGAVRNTARYLVKRAGLSSIEAGAGALVKLLPCEYCCFSGLAAAAGGD
jgi:hypothetical protein